MPMSDVERETYLLHSRLASYRRKVERAQQAIREGLKMMENPYVALSWGKDSEVTTHLAIAERPHVRVMFINGGCGYPETYALRDRLVPEWDLNYIEINSQTEHWADYLRRRGLGVDLDPAKGTRIAKTSWAVKFARANEHDGVIMGLRAEESGRRKIALLRGGVLYRVKADRLWHCCPLAWWSVRDVWAYIVEHDLPYNGLYDHCDAVFPRESLRGGAWTSTLGANYNGRLVWLRKYYPDLWARFAAEFPEIRQYS